MAFSLCLRLNAAMGKSSSDNFTHGRRQAFLSRLPVFALAFLLFSPVRIAAQTATRLTCEEKRAGDSKPRITRFEIGDEGLRIFGVRGKGVTDLVYQRGSGQFILIDEKTKSYRTLGKAQIEQAVSKADAALNQLGELSGNGLDPKQKQTIDALLNAGREALKDATGGSSAAPVYERLATDQRFNGHLCETYAVKQGATKTAELWTTNLVILGLSPQAVATLEDVAAVFENSVSRLTGIRETSAFLPRPGRPGAYSGFPVRRIRLENELPVSEWQLKTIQQITPAAGTFGVPKDYTQKSLIDF